MLMENGEIDLNHKMQQQRKWLLQSHPPTVTTKDNRPKHRPDVDSARLVRARCSPTTRPLRVVCAYCRGRYQASRTLTRIF